MTAQADIPLRIPRVLVVDDERRLRELLVDEITDMGFPARAAGSAEEAGRIMESDACEIVLLDLQLPLMAGMDFFRLLREQWPNTQVIILTGFGGLDAAREAIRMDVVDFLTKPCHLNDIEVALDRARKRLRGMILSARAPDEPPASTPSGGTLADHEKHVILACLARHNGNRAETAQELGISRRTLLYRLAEYRRDGISFE